MLKGSASAGQAIFDWIHFYTLIAHVLSFQNGYIARLYLEMFQEGFDFCVSHHFKKKGVEVIGIGIHNFL